MLIRLHFRSTDIWENLRSSMSVNFHKVHPCFVLNILFKALQSI